MAHDTACLDEIKHDIEDVMRMVLGADAFQEIGAKPPRVRPGLLSSTTFWSAGLEQTAL